MGTKGKIKVMLTTEGTFPFHQGGVSTWCNVMVNELKTVEYFVYSVMMNPYVTQKFTLPFNSTLIKVPLWGTEDPSEHLNTPFSQAYIAKKATDASIVKAHFLPLFREMIQEILSREKDPIKFSSILYDLYKYFKQYDYKDSFKDELVWNTFKELIFSYNIDPENKIPEPNVFDIIQSLGWIFRFFTILNTPLPEVDVTHSSAAAFCGIPGVLAKLERKTPFLLTEHGVYLREQYLNLNRNNYSPYLRTFLIRYIHSITAMNFFMADQVSPVCQYNTRWEKRFGVSSSKIEVIYNGVDRDIFTPNKQKHVNVHPTVVSVARIDPVKDIISLIKAAAIVKERIPDVRFMIYGSISVPDYYEECLVVRQQLDLEETVIFAGHTNNVPSVVANGDVIALSSITEAFPYSVVEAMMAGKAIVATDVGGVREAISDCGMVVPPRKYEEMAQALTTLLNNPELCLTLGEEARKRALNFFTIERSLGLYDAAYNKLARSSGQPQIFFLQLQRQKIHSNKGYALLDLGYWHEAIAQFQKAIEAYPNSTAEPILRMEIAYAYNELGESEKALIDLTSIKTVVDEASMNGVDNPQVVLWKSKRQAVIAEKAYALMELGFWGESITQFQKAIDIYPNSNAVPVLLTEISSSYYELGEVELAREMLSKAKSQAKLKGIHSIA